MTDLQVILTGKNGGTIPFPRYEKLAAKLHQLHKKADAKNESSKFCKQIGKWEVANKCNYCNRLYTFNMLIGDCNHGACERSRCILRSMQDHL